MMLRFSCVLFAAASAVLIAGTAGAQSASPSQAESSVPVSANAYQNPGPAGPSDCRGCFPVTPAGQGPNQEAGLPQPLPQQGSSGKAVPRVGPPPSLPNPLPYDLLLQHGHVIDAKNNVDRVMDVAIKDGKIAAVGEHLNTGDAAKTIDATGYYVVPESIWVLARTIGTVESMQTVIEDSVWRARVAAMLMGILASIALMLAVTGIYSVMSYSVSQRVKELGIRIAFGAGRRNIALLILGETLSLSIFGTVLGGTAALISGRLVSQQLYGIKGNDPITYIVTAVLLMVVALVASFAPARRALQVDPLEVLQQ